MSETALVDQNYNVDLTPEPWALHLMGLINPLVVISGNLLGGVYTVMGVALVWGIAYYRRSDGRIKTGQTSS